MTISKVCPLARSLVTRGGKGLMVAPRNYALALLALDCDELGGGSFAPWKFCNPLFAFIALHGEFSFGGLLSNKVSNHFVGL